VCVCVCVCEGRWYVESAVVTPRSLINVDAAPPPGRLPSLFVSLTSHLLSSAPSSIWTERPSRLSINAPSSNMVSTGVVVGQVFKHSKCRVVVGQLPSSKMVIAIVVVGQIFKHGKCQCVCTEVRAHHPATP